MSSTYSDDDKLPPFFPRSPAECKVESASFFECFNNHAKKNSPDDKNAGVRAVVECKALKHKYEDCMNTKVDKSKLNKKFQVHEEYRSKKAAGEL